MNIPGRVDPGFDPGADEFAGLPSALLSGLPGPARRVAQEGAKRWLLPAIRMQPAMGRICLTNQGG
jgi:hypothetical protein